MLRILVVRSKVASLFFLACLLLRQTHSSLILQQELITPF